MARVATTTGRAILQVWAANPRCRAGDEEGDRVGELLADAKRGQATTPHAIRRILEAALAVRDQRDAGARTPAEAAAQAERLGAQVDKLIADHPTGRHRRAR